MGGPRDASWSRPSDSPIVPGDKDRSKLRLALVVRTPATGNQAYVSRPASDRHEPACAQIRWEVRRARPGVAKRRCRGGSALCCSEGGFIGTRAVLRTRSLGGWRQRLIVPRHRLNSRTMGKLKIATDKPWDSRRAPIRVKRRKPANSEGSLQRPGGVSNAPVQTELSHSLTGGN